ncbi:MULTISPECIES: HAD family hydrolase [unclassified Melioribacter]|uniref:HAD family hydrolase n=1 Tax=unclassified Melioribacter TaxID=2627329 RepID=UPI003BC62D5C
MKKALLFDFGGTLDTDGIHWSEKFFDLYNHFHIPLTKANFREAFVYSERTISNIIKPDFSLKQTLKSQIAYQLEYFKKNNLLKEDFSQNINKLTDWCYSSVIENVKITKEILNQLSNEYLLALISNYYGNIEIVLKELSIKKYFAFIVDSAVIGFRKPDPKIFQFALNELGVNPNNAVMIGDSYNNDIVPAKLIGCKTIWINNRGWNEQNENDKADFIIKSFKELPEILKTINKVI